MIVLISVKISFKPAEMASDSDIEKIDPIPRPAPETGRPRDVIRRLLGNGAFNKSCRRHDVKCLR
jgi:hypothetical protein